MKLFAFKHAQQRMNDERGHARILAYGESSTDSHWLNQSLACFFQRQRTRNCAHWVIPQCTRFAFISRGFHIRRDEIPHRLRTFAQAIENIFGLERSIMRRAQPKIKKGGSLKMTKGLLRFYHGRCSVTLKFAPHTSVYPERLIWKLICEHSAGKSTMQGNRCHSMIDSSKTHHHSLLNLSF
jgi:hypothetical protein